MRPSPESPVGSVPGINSKDSVTTASFNLPNPPIPEDPDAPGRRPPAAVAAVALVSASGVLGVGVSYLFLCCRDVGEVSAPGLAVLLGPCAGWLPPVAWL